MEKLTELRHMRDVLWDLQDDLKTICNNYDGECSLCPQSGLCDALNQALDNVKTITYIIKRGEENV